jgi:hypothetical protein
MILAATVALTLVSGFARAGASDPLKELGKLRELAVQHEAAMESRRAGQENRDKAPGRLERLRAEPNPEFHFMHDLASAETRDQVKRTDSFVKVFLTVNAKKTAKANGESALQRELQTFYANTYKPEVDQAEKPYGGVLTSTSLSSRRDALKKLVSLIDRMLAEGSAPKTAYQSTDGSFNRPSSDILAPISGSSAFEPGSAI